MNTLLTILIAGLTSLGTWFGIEQTQTPTPTIPEINVNEVVSTALGAYNPTGGGTYRLQSSVGGSATSITLTSFKEPVSNIPYTMSYLNSDIEYATVEPQSTNKEFISFSGITQNADGSAILTGVTRGLGFSYPYTASTTLQKPHSGQSILILSNPPQLYKKFATKDNDETISGSWAIPYPTASTSPASKGYVDTLAFGGSTNTDRVVVAGTAGETITQGQILYFDTIQDEWMKADASVLASTTQVLLGVAQGAGTNGVAVSGGVLLSGLDSTNTGGVAGDIIYISNTEGATSTSAGTVSTAIGVMRSSTAFYFSPRFREVSLAANNAFTGNITLGGTASSTIGTASTSVYTTSFTWTKPSQLKQIIVKVVGGGGGGGGTTAADNFGGGGGGGGYCEETLFAQELGATETVTIGAAGALGAGSSAGTGGTGGNTTFGSHCTGNGATGGEGGAGANAGGTGGTATGGDINISGQNGMIGVSTGTANNGIAGGGGSSMLGLGAPLAHQQGTVGAAGTGYGAGGSGAHAGGSASDIDGGAGTVGALILTEVFY